MTARLLVVSNGNGEDDIACKVIDALRASGRGPKIEAWPMVGLGPAYAARGIPVVGVQNTLPSEGFGTLSEAVRPRSEGGLHRHPSGHTGPGWPALPAPSGAGMT